MKEINDFFNKKGFWATTGNWFADDTIKRVIKEEFTDKGIEFDISNIQHRIILGQRMVEINAAGK